MAALRFFKSPGILFQLMPKPFGGLPPRHILGLLNRPREFKILRPCPNKLVPSCPNKSGILGA